MARDFTQYGGQTGTDYIEKKGKTIRLFETPVRFILTPQTIHLTFEGWESASAFAAGDKPLPIYRRIFERYGEDFTVVRTAFLEIFEALETNSLSFLEASDEDWQFESLSINTLELRIIVAATHKTKNKRISEQIDTEAAFHETKTQHPELVESFFVFAWTFGKTSDEFLASLEPVQ
jgi:hypothetical protein